MQLPDFPRKLGSAQVLIRFGVRLLVLVVFATFGGIGFGRSLAALLWMSTILSAVVPSSDLRRHVHAGRGLDQTLAAPDLCSPYEIVFRLHSISYPTENILARTT